MVIRKAQAFALDFGIAIIIFIAAIITYFHFITNMETSTDQSMEASIMDAKILTNSLLGSGVPVNWTPADVDRIGVCDSTNFLNLTKLQYFYNLTSTDYDHTRNLFETNYEYLIFFTDKNDNILNLSGHQYWGMPGINSTNVFDIEDPKTFVTFSRFVYYPKTSDLVDIAKMVVYIWE